MEKNSKDLLDPMLSLLCNSSLEPSFKMREQDQISYSLPQVTKPSSRQAVVLFQKHWGQKEAMGVELASLPIRFTQNQEDQGHLKVKY